MAPALWQMKARQERIAMVSADDARMLDEAGVDVGDTALRNAGRLLSLAWSVAIPVMAHVGLTPQSVHALGGAFAVVLDGSPQLSPSASRGSSRCRPSASEQVRPAAAQVLVAYDLLGLTSDFRPRFVKRYTSFFEDGVHASRTYWMKCERRAFPTAQRSFVSDGTAG
jgi:3-methyl-2-oxobutanoate hydroxymethyltransferase